MDGINKRISAKQEDIPRKTKNGVYEINFMKNSPILNIEKIGTNFHPDYLLNYFLATTINYAT